MIAVRRVEKPTILVRRETEWLRALNSAVGNRARNTAASRYRHEEVRNALQLMFYGKCAYCESKIRHVSFAHIDHFRPKCAYPELTFDWTNLVLACSVCNSQAYKGDKFPTTPDGVRLLVEPSSELPEDHLDFRYDTTNGTASVYGKTARGEVTEKTLGLNRPELRAYRSCQVRRLACLAGFAKTDARAKELMREAMEDSSEYAAFARALASVANREVWSQREATLPPS